MWQQLFRTLLNYIRTPALLSKNATRSDIEDELSFHIAERTREYMAAGMTEHEAHQAACHRFGNPAHYVRECEQGATGGLTVCHRVHLMVTVALIIALTTLLLTRPTHTLHRGASIALMPPGIESLLHHDWTGDITGQVLDQNGQPIADADILVVVKTWPNGSYFQRAYHARPTASGTFLIENVHPLNDRYAVLITAVAGQRELRSSYTVCEGGFFNRTVFTLPPAGGLTLQVATHEGRAIEGVEVLPHARLDAAGDEHLVYFDSAQPVVQRTNKAGRADLPYFQPGDLATLLLRFPRGDWETREFTVPAAGEVAVVRPSDPASNSMTAVPRR